MQSHKYPSFIWVAFALFGTYALVLPPYSIALRAQGFSPEPNPPRLERDEYGNLATPLPPQSQLSIREWALHKTSDNLHPDGREQQLMWLMNRARSNPAQEGYWLASTRLSNVESAVNYFKVDLNLLQEEFENYDAAPPAAFDVRLYNASKAHSENLIQRDTQDHNGQFDHIDRSGFHFTKARGNVFSYTEDALFGHIAFNIDWGEDGGDDSGMQPGRGHRLAIMSIDGDYTNVGLAVLAESNPGTKVGPLVTTGNFCKANVRKTDHYNRFLVGTVWQDANRNAQYDPGEGIPGITVMPDSGGYYAVTANSGGYAFPILTIGVYNVTFSGSGISSVTRTAVVASDKSVLLDLKYTSSSAAEPQAVTDSASNVATAMANLKGTVYTRGRNTDYYFQYGTTTNYGKTTTIDTVMADRTVAVIINGLNPGTTYHFRLVAKNSEGTGIGVDRTFETSAAVRPQASSTGSGEGGCFIMATEHVSAFQQWRR